MLFIVWCEIIGTLKLAAYNHAITNEIGVFHCYNRHSSSKPFPSWLLTSQTMLNSFLNAWGVIITSHTAYNWWCNHDRLILENIPKFSSVRSSFPISKMAAMTYMVNWRYWGDNSNNLSHYWKDNSKYLTFHNSGIFNIRLQC